MKWLLVCLMACRGPSDVLRESFGEDKGMRCTDVNDYMAVCESATATYVCFANPKAFASACILATNPLTYTPPLPCSVSNSYILTQ